MKSILKHKTKMFKSVLVVFTASFLFLFFSFTAFSAMDPEEIRKIHEDAPYHIIGTVTDDKLLQELSVSKNSPSQLRTMTIEISELNRAPTNEPLSTLEILYTYVPHWVEREGGKGMDIAIGDIIEVWLEEGESGLEPAVGGDSVNHLFSVEERPVHFPEPISSKIHQAINAFFQHPHTIGNIVVLSGLVAFSGFLAFLGLRNWKHAN